jgi:hypothetical protein
MFTLLIYSSLNFFLLCKTEVSAEKNDESVLSLDQFDQADHRWVKNILWNFCFSSLLNNLINILDCIASNFICVLILF